MTYSVMQKYYIGATKNQKPQYLESLCLNYFYSSLLSSLSSVNFYPKLTKKNPVTLADRAKRNIFRKLSYNTFNNSTSKTSVEFGGIIGGAPRSP